MKDCDENKENKTPEGSQGEVDWLQQYDMEREREEQELQQALAQSLQEQVRHSVIAFSVLPDSKSQSLLCLLCVRHCSWLFMCS